MGHLQLRITVRITVREPTRVPISTFREDLTIAGMLTISE